MKLHDPQIKLLNRLWLSKQKQKGFALAEVLVAFLTLTLFVSFALQGMVLASLAQIRARDKAEATLIIQQNLEGIRSLAASYTLDKAGSEFRDRCDNRTMAAGLQTQVEASSSLTRSEFTAAASRRSYEISRTLTPNGNVLQIMYRVTKQNTDSGPSNPLAELSTEVIPNVSLQCP